MVQCPTIFHKCTADPVLFHVRYSKLLNSHFNVHCHLPAGLAFVEFVAPCSKNGYVPEYLCLSVCLSVCLSI
jgi:hypothetical protein